MSQSSNRNGELKMNRSASLFASAVLLGGLTVAGHAMAGQYSKTASELIIEHNEEASQPMIPGVHVSQPADDNLDEMVATPNQTQQQASAADRNVVLGGNVDQNDVQVRDPNVSHDPNRTFQGWWKD